MTRPRTLLKILIALAILVTLAQVTASGLVRTQRVHAYLTAQLERAFGRSVDVGRFDVAFLPTLELEADRVTIGEGPGFGQEYFLRADHLTGRLRLIGLLRGKFEFGTLSFAKPSLILVKNSKGRWNLEQWLPPAATNASEKSADAPSPVAPTNRLSRVEFEDGRINFKTGDSKHPFAFISVNGSVEQASAGRWELELAAQPWRSGVPLQSPGTIHVTGGLAGTSTRMQPAEIMVHWEKVSLADLLRLLRGQDYGVRGAFTLDGSLKSTSSLGEWDLALQARAIQLHRWNLSERSDNPRLNLNVEGRWNVATDHLDAQKVLMQSAKSNLVGTGSASLEADPTFALSFDSINLQAADVLAAYRAFRADVADGIAVDEFVSGSAKITGWPFQIRDAVFSSNGGTLKVPGLTETILGAPFKTVPQQSSAISISQRISIAISSDAARRRRSVSPLEEAADVNFSHDFLADEGKFSIDAHLAKVENVLKISSAVGRAINHGWELSGEVAANLQWRWKPQAPGRWDGSVSFVENKLVVAGLNQPLQVHRASVDWHQGARSSTISNVEGFGASWTGEIRELLAPDPDSGSSWNFQLAADHLDAAELDRWVGPRARPGWLQRLLPSLLGTNAQPNNPASQLLRQVNAFGQIDIQHLTVEQLQLDNVHAEGSLADLHLQLTESYAEWAGGKVRARMQATFLPRPAYDVMAQVEGVDLAQLPITNVAEDYFGGKLAGSVHLTTQGVGRQELLQHLEGGGNAHLSKVEFHQWNVPATLAGGTPQPGSSQWATGVASFNVAHEQIVIRDLRLTNAGEFTTLKGTLTFGRETDLQVQAAAQQKEKRAVPYGRILNVSGPLEALHFKMELPAVAPPAEVHP